MGSGIGHIFIGHRLNNIQIPTLVLFLIYRSRYDMSSGIGHIIIGHQLNNIQIPRRRKTVRIKTK